MSQRKKKLKEHRREVRALREKEKSKKHWLDAHIEKENKVNGEKVMNIIRNAPEISELDEPKYNNNTKKYEL